MYCCLNCKNARRACNDDYVGCVFWEHEKEKEMNSKTLNDIMEELNVKQLATGWVYLGRYPEQADVPDVTVSANLMTNGVICFEKTFVCKQFRKRVRHSAGIDIL